MVPVSPRDLRISHESWPIAGKFTIARGSKTQAEIILAEISQGALLGRGEAVPYARYGETPESVAAQISAHKTEIEQGMGLAELQTMLPPGAARNALDCALWELQAKQTGTPVWQLAGLDAPKPVTTAFTISLDSPDNMAKAAAKAAHMPLLKLKLGGKDDHERLEQVRKAAPKTRLIVDANESWDPQDLESLLFACHEADIELVEQPLPADRDEILADIAHPVPICADESIHGGALHGTDSLKALIGRYDAVNIKLDKTGGLTEAILLAKSAKQAGFKIMIGCMVATSLAMAPALLLADLADFVDLDGPLLLARDRDPGLKYQNGVISSTPRGLWA